ncbi:MAG: PAS domain S-box protein [Lutibacter sp.]|uniref:hybrid sensor histidine kinase/response regulator n=1 Tax=Lutibacter sp. TaxID=1925666 RepID=UPI001791EDFF|nr:PAS domain S-box protein [Lutibacter sp.]MBT8317702.1 PAS domain S-box protein [Lutibacter sp.]NNJ58560.1 PAS domain S-box protein [Lutibacter sp.]
MTTMKPTYQELEKELKTLKRHKESHSFEELVLLYENIKDGFVILNKNWEYTFLNKSAEEMFGVQQKDVLGKKMESVFPDVIDKPFYKYFSKVFETKTPITFEDYFEPLNKWFENKTIPFKEGLAIFFHDITAQKISEANLITTVNILERSSSVAFLWKAEEYWPVDYVSKNVELLFEYTAEDFLSNKITYKELIHPDHINEVTQELEKYSLNKATSFIHKPYKIITKSGKIKWVKDETRIVRNKSGDITHYEGILVDISKNVHIEQELLKLDVAIQNSLHEVYIFDAQNLQYTYANSAALKSLGYTLNELLKMSPVDVAPDFTKEKARAKLAPLKNGKVESIHFETHRERKNKTIYPVEVHLSKFVLNGKEQFLAIINDITERKQIENSLIESENKFKAYTNQSTEGLSVADLKGNYTFVNPAFCKLVGYSEKELLQMTVFDVTADKKDTNTFKRSISTNEEESVIVELIHKNGTTFIAEIIGKNIIINGKKRVLGIVRDITKRIAQEQQLVESKFLLSEAQKIAKIGSYALDIETGFWTSSSVLNALFGIDKEYKKDIGGWLAIVHPKDRLQLQEYLFKNIVEDHQFFDREYRIKRLNDGEERYVHGLGKLEFRNGKLIRMIGTIQDITDQKKSALALARIRNEVKASEKKFRQLYEKSGDAIMIGKNGKFIDVNDAAVNMFGYKSKKQFLAVHPKKLSPKFQPNGLLSYENSKELITIAQEKGTHRFEWTFLRKNGKKFPAEILLTSISNKPNNKVVHGVLRDITERKIIETQLIESKKKAEESNRLKTEFINNMSHEIRTPMNGILGFSEFLADSNISDEKRLNFVKIIQNSGHQLLKIIDDILEISKLETKQIKIFEEPFNLNDLLFELFSIFDGKAKENNTPLYLEKGLSNNKSIIKSDKSKLYKIVSNLLENALKFTNVGHIEFGYKLRQENKQDLLEIYVKDTGRGIKKEDQQVIFERFVQSEKDSANKIEGLGLGLSIAKENTELLGGTITLESAKGKGTTFFVRIPYNPVVDIEDTVEQLADKLNILIVEDEEVNYLYLTTLIEVVLKINCTISHAKNGVEAIHFCENNPKIDLILMDLKMPVMDGFIATKKIKEVNSTIPILAQTAYSTKIEKEKAMQAGCDDFISKPITKEVLLDKLKTLIPNL